MRPGRSPSALRDFFDRSVHDVARELVGCRLFFDGVGGTIVETESYERDDPACHAYVGLTDRTEVLFGPPGLAYVYLSYGIHSLLNFVAEPEGEAAAVLIRALEPTAGLEAMRERRGDRPDGELCSGPGKLTEALGIGLERNGADLSRDPFLLLGAGGRRRPRSSPARGSASPKRSSAPGASAPPAAASSRGPRPELGRLAGGDAATAAAGFRRRFRRRFGAASSGAASTSGAASASGAASTSSPSGAASVSLRRHVGFAFGRVAARPRRFAAFLPAPSFRRRGRP